MSRLRRGLAVALVALGAAGAACGGGTLQQGPSDTLRAYARALEEGRVEDAYRLLSDEARRSISLEAFRRAVKESPEEAAEIARALSRPASDPVVTASVVLPSGEEVGLVFEGGRWRLDGASIDLYSQATPRQTLEAFVRAYDHKRYDILLRLVPDAELAGVPSGQPDTDAGAPDAGARASEPIPLTKEKLRSSWEGPEKDEIARIVQAVRTALPTSAIEETGDSAQMEYGGGGTVALSREHGVWKISDL